MPVQFRKALCLAALPSFALAAAPAAATPKYLTYYLPKTEISGAVSQRLVYCPYTDEPITNALVETTWKLKAKAVPDYAAPVDIDVSSGFLAARTVGVKLNGDGTLASLNAESSGQGGEILASAIKLAGTVAPLLAGVPALPNFAQILGVPADVPVRRSRCKDEIVLLLDNHAKLEKVIAETEREIRSGQSTPGLEAMLVRDRQQLRSVEEGLTLSKPAPGLNAQIAALKPCETVQACEAEGRSVIARLDYTKWFVDPVDAASLPGGRDGFVVQWVGSKAAAASLARMPGKAPLSDKMQELVYLRPVPAVLVGGPCANAACDLDESDAAADATGALEFTLAQLSPRFALPVGSAGIFGSREVSASFDAWGRPTELKYGSDPGAAAMAGIIDAAGATAASINAAELDAMTHAVAVEEARDKLAALRADQ